MFCSNLRRLDMNGCTFCPVQFVEKIVLKQLWYGASGAKAAIFSLSLFNSDVTVLALWKTICCIGEVLRFLYLSCWPRNIFSR